MTNLTGKRVLLTGAAGGLGTELGRQLSEAGATVVGVDRDQARLDDWCRGIESLGFQVRGVAWDLSELESLGDLVDRIESESGPIDVLINNAGLASYRAFEDCSLQHLQAVITVNLMAAMELTRLLLPKFRARQQGHVLSVASLAAKMAHPYDAVYSASKAGLLLWSDSLRQELVDTPIQVSVVCPGYIAQSGMFAKTQLPAPKLSGISTPALVAQGVLRAIQTNHAELIVNQGTVGELSARATCAISQLFPSFGDWVSHSLGVPELNRQRADARKQRVESVVVDR